MSDSASNRGLETAGRAGAGHADAAAVPRSAAAGPRKVNRRDPEKRREQNRAAQKVYRERQKQKLRDLETQLHQVQQTKQPDEPSSVSPPQQPPHQAFQMPPTTIAPADLSAFQTSFPPSMDTMSAANAGLDMDMPMFHDLLPFETSSSLPLPPQTSTTYAPEPDFLTGILPPNNALFTNDFLSGTLLNSQDQYNIFRTANSWVSAPPSWNVDAKTIPWRPARPSDLGSRSRPTEAGTADEVIEVERRPARGAAWKGDTIIHCSCLDYHEPLGRCMGKVQVFPDPMTVRWREPTPEPEYPGQRLADIHRNNIQVQQMCVMDAMLRNLVLIGVPVSTFCADETESPFYNSGASDSDADSTLKAVQLSWRSLRHDLRPTKIQVAKSHHPYIDVFPIPSVRKRLVELQYEIDEDSFFIDAIKGFRCWGSRRDSKRDQPSGTGSPWDMRSWEATPEFLKKWECVLGDEEGEMARQSRWWRELRGEEDDNM
ncbi:hypothetical protein F5X68DRAFT_275111 [Plectosphaerella plurivora]|uniref:BZIP domain-containing protein n=1 Tax=Plectosphaerella plurivora TaxID=936078 RepID=A0A9P8VEF5_9PEZI|nr:hypothetical protein F5X68DRAFT_275111 [Plectosphaerella plurivora]